MKVDPQQLKSFIVDIGLLTNDEFDDLIKISKRDKKDISEVIIETGILPEESLIKIKAHISGVPFINLEDKKIDPEVLRIIPEQVARSNNIVAYRNDGKNLEVAMIDPENLSSIDFIKKKTGLDISPILTNEASIKSALKQYHESLETEFSEIIGIDKKVKKNSEEKKLEDVAKEISIVKIVDTLIKHATLQGASDIHIEPQEKELIVRYRIDGILREAMILPINISLGVIARIKVLSNLKLDEHRLPQDGRFKVSYDESKFSLRVSILPVSNGEKIVMRILPETSQILTLEEIGLRNKALENINDNLKKTTGMILITGPTGSGKTSTLYSILDILNTSEVNISTIEDPIEYQIERINQTQVIPKIGLTFAAGLRSLVRQDPDIIMVGEIRDTETAKLSINAALTGHLVLSTLHTTSAAGAVSRLIDMEIEPFLISSTLNIIIAQRLVRKLHKEKEKYFLSDEEIESLKKYYDVKRIHNLLEKLKILKKGQQLKDIPFYKPKPGKDSLDGYQGRIGIFEVIDVTDEIKKMIVKKIDTDEIHKKAQEEGMISLMEDGFIKAAQGITSIEEILRVIIE